MQNNPLIIIFIVGAIALILGALAGYFGALLENRVNKSLDEARDDIDPNDPNIDKPEPVVTDHDILKVTIDPMFKLKLALDGILLEPDTLTAEQRARLLNVIVQIRPWIDSKTPPPTTTQVPAMPNPVSSVPTMPTPMASLTPNVSPFPAFTPSSTTPTINAPRIDAARGLRSWLESDLKKPEPLLKNDIVSQIDAVLQKNLENSRFERKKIRLEEGSLGEVVVFVGAVRYAGIDAVPDEEIRAIIQASVKEWNDK